MRQGMDMVYVIREMLRAVKREMDEKGLSFDEMLVYYDEGVKILENADNIIRKEVLE